MWRHAKMSDHDERWTRNVDVIPQIAQELRNLARELEQDAAAPSIGRNGDRLLIVMQTAAEFLTEIHKFILTVPMVVSRGKAESMVEGYRSAAGIVREFAAEVERGRVGPIRPHAALLRAAAILEAATEETRPAPSKPKLVLN